MKTEMFAGILGDKTLQTAAMDFHRLLRAPLPPEKVDLEQVYAQTIDQLKQEDPEFADNFTALSEDQRQTFKKDVIKAVGDALKGKGLDFDAVRKGFLASSYECRIKDHDFIVTREGETLLHLTNLDTSQGIADATWIQIASVIVEAVFLIVSIVGSVPRPTGKVIDRAAAAIARKVAHTPALQRAVARIVEAFKSGSRWDQAKSIFLLLKEVHAAGLVIIIVKILLSDLKWYDYALMVAKTLAYIAAAVLTDGLALIAKLVLILDDAVEFAIKLANLDKLNTMALAMM
jgi:hypothetical protein